MVKEAIGAAVHTTLDMNTGNMIAIDSLNTHDFALSSDVPDTQDSPFKAIETWHGRGDISITTMQQGPPISLIPTPVTAFHEDEWDKEDFLGDDL